MNAQSCVSFRAGADQRPGVRRIMKQPPQSASTVRGAGLGTTISFRAGLTVSESPTRLGIGTRGCGSPRPRPISPGVRAAFRTGDC